MEAQRKRLVPARLGKPRLRRNPDAPYTWRWSCELEDSRGRKWRGNGNTAEAAYDQLAMQLHNLDRMGLLWEVFP